MPAAGAAPRSWRSSRGTGRRRTRLGCDWPGHDPHSGRCWHPIGGAAHGTTGHRAFAVLMLRPVMLSRRRCTGRASLVGGMTMNAFIEQHSVVSHYVLRSAIAWGVVGRPRKRLQLEGSTSVVGQPEAAAAVSRASCWLGRAVRGAVAAGLLFGLATSIVLLGSAPPASAADVAATVIARYRERVPELMAEHRYRVWPSRSSMAIGRCGSRASATGITRAALRSPPTQS
jgi:hypothetical protein